MKKKEFTSEQTQEIIQKYLNNCSLQTIANNYQVSRTVITRILKDAQIKLRERTHKYTANYNIFENIDTAEKAYWLGFLAADGCNYSREHNASIILNIQVKDILHLQKFQTFCETDAPIIQYIANGGFSNNTPMARLVLNSKKMSQDLSRAGVMPAKSLILKQPQIDPQFYLPFILGYFDGDGSIYQSTNTNYIISIEGTKELLNWICEILKWDTKLEQRVINPNINNYYIRCGGTNKPYYLLKQLYDSCETHLDRKYNIYKNLETVVLSRNTK